MISEWFLCTPSPPGPSMIRIIMFRGRYRVRISMLARSLYMDEICNMTDFQNGRHEKYRNLLEYINDHILAINPHRKIFNFSD